jgi:hypothetical protein
LEQQHQLLHLLLALKLTRFILIIKKLKIIRDELSKRHLSPHEKKKRDILIPVTTTAAVYLVSMGIAGVVDIVPDAMQVAIHEPIQEGFLISVSVFNNALLSSQIYLLIICFSFIIRKNICSNLF